MYIRIHVYMRVQCFVKLCTKFGVLLQLSCACIYIYSTVQMQGITNARLRSRATAFVSACEHVRLRV